MTVTIAYFLLYLSDDNFQTYIEKGLRVTSPFTYSGLNDNTAYKLKLKSVDTTGRISPFSETISFSTLVDLIAPVLNSATSIVYDGFTVSWGAVANATSYRVDVSIDNFNTFVSGYNNLQVMGTSTAITGLTQNIACQVRVRAENSGGVSDNSNVITATPVIGVPTATEETAKTLQGFTAGWNSVTGATGYKLTVATSSDLQTGIVSGWNEKAVTGTSDVVTGLTINGTYYYGVKSTDGVYTSVYSNIITATPSTAINTLIYASDVSGRSYIYKADFTAPDTLSNISRVTSTSGITETIDYQVRLSRDGRYLVYTKEVYAGKSQIFYWDFVTGTETQVTNNASLNYQYVNFIPNSTDIFAVENYATGLLVKFDKTSLVRTQLRSSTSNGVQFGDFNADGSKFIYTTITGGIYQLREIPTSSWTGSTTLLRSFGASIPQYARYNHDFTKIMYTRTIPGVNTYQVHECDADGANEIMKPTTNNLINNYSICEDPTGTYKSFSFRATSSDFQVYKCDSDYTDQAVWINNVGNYVEIPLDWNYRV